MDSAHDPAEPDFAEIERQFREAARKKAAAVTLPRTTGQKRKGEARARGRVNPALLKPDTDAPRDARWTILIRPDHKRAVQALADRLSEPRAKVSYAALMEEAIDLLLAKYQDGAEEGT